jgi:hypothetical protein
MGGALRRPLTLPRSFSKIKKFYLGFDLIIKVIEKKIKFILISKMNTVSQDVFKFSRK